MKNLNKILSILTVFVFFIACSVSQSEDIEEDYDQNFAEKPADKPDISYEDMDKLPCNPSQELENYQYPGVEITQNRKSYEIELRVYFNERLVAAGDRSRTHSEVNISYVDSDKSLVKLHSLAIDNQSVELIKNQEYVKKIKAYSGYPLYLSVTGAGFHNFNIKASIMARAEDQSVVVPSLFYTASTGADGFQELDPYCEMIILP